MAKILMYGAMIALVPLAYFVPGGLTGYFGNAVDGATFRLATLALLVVYAALSAAAFGPITIVQRRAAAGSAVPPQVSVTFMGAMLLAAGLGVWSSMSRTSEHNENLARQANPRSVQMQKEVPELAAPTSRAPGPATSRNSSVPAEQDARRESVQDRWNLHKALALAQVED